MGQWLAPNDLASLADVKPYAVANLAGGFAARDSPGGSQGEEQDVAARGERRRQPALLGVLVGLLAGLGVADLAVGQR